MNLPQSISFFFREGLKEAKKIFEEYFDAHFCHQTPSFEHCAETDRSKFNLILYNSHAQPFSGYVKLPLTDYFELSITENSAQKNSTTVPVNDNFTKKFGQTAAKYEAIFYAENIPPLGVKIYQIEKATETEMDLEMETETINSIEKEMEMDLEMGTETINSIEKATETEMNLEMETETINSMDYVFKSIELSEIPKFLPKNLVIQMGYYISTYFSGAYIIRFENEIPILPKIKQAKVLITGIFKELHVFYQNGWSYTAKCYLESSDCDELEIQWITGHLEPDQEAFISYKLTNFSSHETFYTDSNGLYTGDSF